MHSRIFINISAYKIDIYIQSTLYFITCCVCMCVMHGCVCVPTCVGIYVCADMCGGQKCTLGVDFMRCPPYVLRQSLSGAWGSLTKLRSMASELQRPACLLPQCWDYKYKPSCPAELRFSPLHGKYFPDSLPSEPAFYWTKHHGDHKRVWASSTINWIRNYTFI